MFDIVHVLRLVQGTSTCLQAVLSHAEANISKSRVCRWVYASKDTCSVPITRARSRNLQNASR